MGEIQNRPEPEFYDEENDSSPENPQGKPSAGEWEHDVVAGEILILYFIIGYYYTNDLQWVELLTIYMMGTNCC